MTSKLSRMKKARQGKGSPDNGPSAEDLYSPSLASATRRERGLSLGTAYTSTKDVNIYKIVQSKVPWLRLGAVAVASAEPGIHAAVGQCQEAFVERSTRISGASPQTAFVIRDLHVADVGVLLKALEEVDGLQLTAGTVKALRNIGESHVRGKAGPPSSFFKVQLQRYR